jgi:alpha-tubulin suppressor-like RCC1 family protein
MKRTALLACLLGAIAACDGAQPAGPGTETGAPIAVQLSAADASALAQAGQLRVRLLRGQTTVFDTIFDLDIETTNHVRLRVPITGQRDTVVLRIDATGAAGVLSGQTTVVLRRETLTSVTVSLTGSATPLAPVVGTSPGVFHTCTAVRPNAFCWGLNDTGQSAVAQIDEVHFPTRVQQPAGTAFAFARAAYRHSCGLLTNGQIVCWGSNEDGVLGSGPGAGAERRTPAPVSGLQIYQELDLGAVHTCGLTTVGAVLCWGDNSRGQLGNGTNVDRDVPTPVPGVVFRAIAAGGLHTCGITLTGAAFCWGMNEHGQLGDGTTIDRPAPVQVLAGAGVSFTSISAGGLHTCAVTTAGLPFCWGDNSRGQIGDGSFQDRLVPTRVTALASATAITAGGMHSCAIANQAGAAYCWGYNASGSLGTGSTNDSATPVQVAGGFAFAAIVAGLHHTCGEVVQATQRRAMCWGYNVHGELGDGSDATALSPVVVVVPAGGAQ